MSTTPQPPADRPDNGTSPQKRPLWRKALKITAITAISLIALLLLAISALVAILTPDRLTPLVEKYATEYIDGRLTASRIELTFWSTFPRLRVDVDSLTVYSHALDKLPDTIKAALPADADRLLHIDHFDGDIHVLRLLAGEIEVYNVNIVRPAATIVQATPTVASYDILPTSEEATATSTPLPDISIGSFVIEGDAPIRYVSLPDSTDISITLATSSIKGGEPHSYDLRFKAITDAGVKGINLRGLRLGLGGRVILDLSDPAKIEARGLTFGLNELTVKMSALLQTAPEMMIKSLDVDIPKVSLKSLMAMIPASMKEGIPAFDTDMTLEGAVRLTSPYIVGGGDGKDTIPSFDGRLKLDAGSFKMQQLNLHRLALDVEASVDGHNLDRSVITLKDLQAKGNAVGIALRGTATRLISDPDFDVHFNGSLDVTRLPSMLLSRLPAALSGKLEADATFKGRMSYLDRENFHRVKATGRATLDGLTIKMKDGSMEAAIRHARLDLGTSNSFVKDSHRVDSMLTVSLKIDTISVTTPDMKMGASDMKAGIGMMNRASSADTSSINPVGATFHIGHLNFISEADTMRVRLKDVDARAALTRYHGGARKPLLSLNISAGRIRWADRFNRASLADGDITMRLHPSDYVRPKTDPARRDSLRARYAAMRDSLANVDSLDRRDNLDLQVDRSMRKLLIRWQASGQIKASKARVMTPFFPLRCRLENLNVNFTTDSISVTDSRLKVGKSDFTLNGSISNITRSLVTGRAPIKVNLSLESDNIDVNELANAAFAGSAFAERVAAGENIAISDSDNDDIIETSVSDSTGEVAALLVPSNVDADLSVRARNVIYSDLRFNSLAGAVRVHDGALNLDGLTARSDVGRVDLTALYSAPTRRDLNFAFGMRLSDFKIDDFIGIMPAVDSIMPLLNDIKGIINADIAATTTLDPNMNINLPSLSALMTITGDSLVLLDAETFRSIGKWLLFKDKQHNMIDHMQVKLIVKDSQLQLYPFMFDMDRYRLGVMGSNDLALNYKYHVSVLKSPIPFKFGINISGNPDKMKIRLGGAKFKENMAGESMAIADTTRINLLRSIQSAFRRGVRNGKVAPPQFRSPDGVSFDDRGDTISHADSLLFIEKGLIPAPPATTTTTTQSGKKKKK